MLWYIIPDIKHVNTWRSVGSNRILMSRFITSFLKSAMHKNANSLDHKIVIEVLYSRMRDDKGEGSRLIHHPQLHSLSRALMSFFLFSFLIFFRFNFCFQRIWNPFIYKPKEIKCIFKKCICQKVIKDSTNMFQ